MVWLGGTIWRGLAIGNLIPWVDVQTIKNTGGRPRLLWRGFPVRLTADSTGRTIPELKRPGQVFPDTRPSLTTTRPKGGPVMATFRYSVR